MERGITPVYEHTASITRPYAEVLVGGNEEEVFIEYFSNRLDGIYFSKEEFDEERHGLFMKTMFEQQEMSGNGETGPKIARSTKSCRPDWALKFRGAPLAYEEGKSSPHGDTTEGLSYTTLCLANILNFMPKNPAIVMHSTNTRFRFQAVHLDFENSAFQVLQRDGMRYDIIDPRPALKDINPAMFNAIPIMYSFDRIATSVLHLEQLQPHVKSRQEDVQRSAKTAFEAKEEAEQLYQKKVKVEDSPQRSYIEGDVYVDPHNPDASTCLLLKVEEQTELIHELMALPSKLRQDLTAAFKAIDVMTVLMLEQDPDNAAYTYSVALDKELCQTGKVHKYERCVTL